MEVTRGVWERDFPFPPADVKPTVVMFTQEKSITGSKLAESGAKVITVPEICAGSAAISNPSRCSPQVLAKQEAAKAGVSEAWMVEDGYVTEGGSSTAFIITKDGRIVTRPLSNAILPGITRQAVMRLAEEQGLTLEERLFTVEEALDAGGSLLHLGFRLRDAPTVEMDGKPIADGKPGPLTRRLRALYLDMAQSHQFRKDGLKPCARIPCRCGPDGADPEGRDP